jgi:hypothetical protein
MYVVYRSVDLPVSAMVNVLALCVVYRSVDLPVVAMANVLACVWSIAVVIFLRKIDTAIDHTQG